MTNTISEKIQHLENCWKQKNLYQEYKLLPDNIDKDRYRAEYKKEIITKNKSYKSNTRIIQPTFILDIVKSSFQYLPSLNLHSINNTSSQIDIFLKNDFISVNNIPGVGDIQPNIIIQYKFPKHIKVAISAQQLRCTNEIPSNRRVGTILNFNYASPLILKDFLVNSRVITEDLIYLLCDMAAMSFDEDIAFTYFRDFYGSRWNDTKEAKVLEAYEEAPNALPGTLLGAVNCITHMERNSNHTVVSNKMFDLALDIVRCNK